MSLSSLSTDFSYFSFTLNDFRLLLFPRCKEQKIFSSLVEWLIQLLSNHSMCIWKKGYKRELTIGYRRERIRLIASIESALGFMNIKEIVTADPRLDALIVSIFFALMNKHLTYPFFTVCCRGLLCWRRTYSYTKQERNAICKTVSCQRCCCVRLTSYRFGEWWLCLGWSRIDCNQKVCVDYQNKDVLIEECKEGREFGFTGKQAIHPDQIDIIQSLFLPDPKGISISKRGRLCSAFYIIDLERAVRILEGYEHYSQKGIGAFNLDGKM